MRRYAWFVLALTAVSSLGASPTARGADFEDAFFDRRTELRTLDLINRERKQRNVRLLDLNTAVRRGAREHSFEMGEDREVSFQGFDARIRDIKERDRGIDTGTLCALITRVRGGRSERPQLILERFLAEPGVGRCLFDRDGVRRNVGAVGIVLSDSADEDETDAFYVTFIAARDRT